MIHTAKLALASVALAAVVAASPIALTAAHAATEPQAVELLNGTKVLVKGDEVFVVDASGKEIPAPDGKHVAKDGTTIETKEGKIVAN